MAEMLFGRRSEKSRDPDLPRVTREVREQASRVDRIIATTAVVQVRAIPRVEADDKRRERR